MLVGELVEHNMLINSLKVFGPVALWKVRLGVMNSQSAYGSHVLEVVTTNRNTYGACVCSQTQFLITFDFLLLQHLRNMIYLHMYIYILYAQYFTILYLLFW